MRGHLRHRLVVEVDHDGHIRVENCDTCTDPGEALRIMHGVVRHMEPMAQVARRAAGQPPVAQESSTH